MVVKRIITEGLGRNLHTYNVYEINHWICLKIHLTCVNYNCKKYKHARLENMHESSHAVLVSAAYVATAVVYMRKIF